MAESGLLRPLEDVGTLHKPLLVASFVRKNGVNTTAAASLMHRIRSHELQPIAQFDPEPYFDFTQSRPQVRNEGSERIIDFPRNRVHLERGADGGRDALIVSGIEPHLRWRHFSRQLSAFAESLGVESVLILRSFPASVPHTRPVLLRLTTTSEELASELGLNQLQPSYEGPIDIGEVVATELAATGVTIGGMTKDEDGLLYLGSVQDNAVWTMDPDTREKQRLVQDDRLLWSDAMSISSDGYLYIPAPQLRLLPKLNNGANLTQGDFTVYRMKPADSDQQRRPT